MPKDEDISIGEKTWKKNSEPVQKDGFREGIEAGTVESFQEGYDIGYTNGFKAGFHMSYYNAALRSVQEIEKTEDSMTLVYEKPERGHCGLCPKILNKMEMADSITDYSNIHDMISKNQNDLEQLKKDTEKTRIWLDSLK